MKLVIASSNENKIKEIKAILSPFFEDITSARTAGFDKNIEENGSTFAENALIKARAVCKALNCAALADDSGICVDALGGLPGVYSARYSGGGDRENNLKLLKAMENIADRSCKFVCAVALVYPDGREVTAEGETKGRLLINPEGAGGFGYDSLFFSFELNKSFGLASEDEKNRISHRAKALKALIRKL
jgi:XTP/dITP diphosphohydrolase